MTRLVFRAVAVLLAVGLAGCAAVSKVENGEPHGQEDGNGAKDEAGHDFPSRT